MKILLSGVETNNKGAELMLYAILQEIERKFPDAEVYIPYNRLRQGVDYVKTNVTLKYTPFSKFVYDAKIDRIFQRLHIPMSLIERINLVKDAAWFIDGSGFLFSDKFNIKQENVNCWTIKLRSLYLDGSKIVFLPQAFGPAHKKATRELLSVLNKYSSIIMPREKISYKVLSESGLMEMSKIRQFTDFTSLVEGIFPSRYDYLRDGVCIIPNRQMINKGTISKQNYLLLLDKIIKSVVEKGRKVYLLNHEGRMDRQLCLDIKENLSSDIEVVTGLNALEVKGLIASAYLVVTSRFHGLASALNSCVPALATSWSHKYEELYHDYSLDGYVLPIDNHDKTLGMINKLLDSDENTRIREHLKKEVPLIKEQTRKMWDTIWSI